MQLKNETSRCDPQQLEAYLNDTLSESAAADVEVHLSVCAVCREQLEQSAADQQQWQIAQSLLRHDHFDRDPVQWMFNSGKVDEAGQGEATMLSREIRGWLDPTDDPQSLGRFAGYEIVGIVGHGGMGIVLKGFEGSLNRLVAIKVLAPRMATNGSARKRFAREAQATAAVRDDNVIAIHRVDEWHALPYLVMPYVGGVSLQKRIDMDGPLNIVQTLRIGVQIAAGLSAAHAQGLVHRDIKPANILLEQGIERVTITDFGLARAVDDASMTCSGVIAGTPQYMSPEQAEAKPLDARSDLFSLGSVLYAMATGRPPFRGEGSFEVLKRISSQSARPMREIEPTIPEWLEQLVSQLHAKSPEERPQSAKEVAEILKGCLAHLQRPDVVPLPKGINVRRVNKETKAVDSSTLRSYFGLRQLFCKHSISIGVFLMFATITIGLMGMFLWQSTAPPDITGNWTGEAWGRVEMKELEPGQYTGTAVDRARSIELKWSRAERRFNGTWKGDGDRGGQISIQLVDKIIRGAWTTNKTPEPQLETPQLADLLWIRSANQPTTLGGHANHVNSAVFSPDGKTLAAGDSAGTVILWDLSTQRMLRTLNNVQVIQCVDFSPDGKTLVTADRGFAITFWDVKTGKEIKKIKEHDAAVMSVSYSPEGTMLASAGLDTTVKIWDSSTGEVRATLRGHESAIQEVVFSPDETKLASVDLAGALKIWDPVNGELLRTFKVDRSGMGLAFSPNGKILASANYPAKVQLLDVATGRVLGTLLGHKNRVRDVAFSPDGHVLASAGDDQTIRLWDVASRQQIGLLSGHTNRVHDVEFSPDGKTLASGSADNTSKVWTLRRFMSGWKKTAATTYRLIIDAKRHVADIKSLGRTSVITVPPNRKYEISCAGRAHNNNNGGDDLFYGVVLYYQDKNDADGNNSVFTVLRPGDTLKTGEIYGNSPPGRILKPQIGTPLNQFGTPLNTWRNGRAGRQAGELRAFFVDSSNVTSKNSGRYTLTISGASKHTLVVDSKKHVLHIDEDLNAACLEIPSGSRYKVSCLGTAKNNTNGGDDLFYGVLVYYQDTMDADGNHSVYRVLRDGDSFTTDTIYGSEGIGKLKACFLESNSGASDNRGQCTIHAQRVQTTVK